VVNIYFFVVGLSIVFNQTRIVGSIHVFDILMINVCLNSNIPINETYYFN
jgi:hypothetical protein